jgi:leader peptidase (prepilin peptidase)/N-methyltransferase
MQIPLRLETAAAWFVLAVLGPVLSIVDVTLFRLPDAIVLPASLVVLALLAASASAHRGQDLLTRSLATGLVSGLVMAGLALLARGGLGWGDVKVCAGLLGPVLGVVGWWALATAGLLAFGGAAVAAHILRIKRDLTRVPLGPFLFGATLLVVLVNPPS